MSLFITDHAYHLITSLRTSVWRFEHFITVLIVNEKFAYTHFLGSQMIMLQLGRVSGYEQFVDLAWLWGKDGGKNYKQSLIMQNIKGTATQCLPPVTSSPVFVFLHPF